MVRQFTILMVLYLVTGSAAFSLFRQPASGGVGCDGRMIHSAEFFHKFIDFAAFPVIFDSYEKSGKTDNGSSGTSYQRRGA